VVGCWQVLRAASGKELVSPPDFFRRLFPCFRPHQLRQNLSCASAPENGRSGERGRPVPGAPPLVGSRGEDFIAFPHFAFHFHYINIPCSSPFYSPQIYDTLNEEGVYCSLLTGQEKRLIPFSDHTSATVRELANDSFYCFCAPQIYNTACFLRLATVTRLKCAACVRTTTWRCWMRSR